MSEIKILDCTLRDGGYINEWKFGKEAIQGICRKNEELGIDIIEFGFLRNVNVNSDIAMFSSLDQLQEIVDKKNENIKYAIMLEMSCHYPDEKILPRTESTFDLIRYVFWKRQLDEGLEYCKRIKEKGYDLAVQPTRVEQYSKNDFKEMILRFNDLQPYSLAIVDTFGLLSKDKLLMYVEIADRYLDKNILLGYHAHNNQQQAMTNAIAFVESELDRKILIDVSAFGMGKGAGNLNSELFLNYLNQKYYKNYNISKIFEMWDLWIKDIYDKYKWGYSYYYFISAYYGCNPEFATYFMNNHISVTEANRIIQSMPYEDRIVFSENKIQKYMENSK